MTGSFPTNLLGRKIATEMGLVRRGNKPAAARGLVCSVNGVETFEIIFGDIGLLKCDPVKIELRPDTQPYGTATPRCITFPILPQVKEELQHMQSLGIIEEVKEATDWCAAAVNSSSGFWQIDPSCRKLTTFITPVGWVCFRRLPFGTMSAPEIFQEKMTTSLKGHAGTVVIMDDILILGRFRQTMTVTSTQ